MAISLGKMMGIYSWLGVPLNFSDRLLEVDFLGIVPRFLGHVKFV